MARNVPAFCGARAKFLLPGKVGYVFHNAKPLELPWRFPVYHKFSNYEFVWALFRAACYHLSTDQWLVYYGINRCHKVWPYHLLMRLFGVQIKKLSKKPLSGGRLSWCGEFLVCSDALRFERKAWVSDHYQPTYIISISRVFELIWFEVNISFQSKVTVL